MPVEIAPEPGEDERRAIIAALAEAEAADRPPSPWARSLLPRREDEPAGEDGAAGP